MFKHSWKWAAALLLIAACGEDPDRPIVPDGPDNPPATDEISIQVETGTATDITAHSAVLSGTWTEVSGEVLETGFEWASASEKQGTFLEASGTESPFSVTLEDLEQEKEYWFCAYVKVRKDDKVKYFYGENVSFTTGKEDTPVTPPAPETGYFVKVTGEQEDWSGDYLIVNEDKSVAFDGSSVQDKSGNYKEVTITDQGIEANAATLGIRFTVAPSGGAYTIQGQDGKYIGRSASSNGLDILETPATNTIKYYAAGKCIDITGSGSYLLRFNVSYGFRYYKTGAQKDIQLYKLNGTMPGPVTPEPGEMNVTVTTGSASGVTVSSAVLAATFSGATDPVREAGFEWGTSSSALTETLQAETAASPFSASLNGLGDDKTYWYRAYVILQRGSEMKTFYGSVKSFTTLRQEDTPSPQPGSNAIGWYELPLMSLGKSGDYYYNTTDNTQYYAWHMCSGGEKGPGGKTARNYTVCYSGKYHCPLWVAAPRHSMYVGGSGRNDNYRRDGKIPGDIQYSSQSTGGGCNKGHMLGSAERTSSVATNKDVFYYPNIAPQLSKGFNTGGGGWNKLEDWVDDQVCADTLYEVVGCYFDKYKDGYGIEVEPEIISFGGRDDVSMPTMFYYVLLRTKNGSSRKALKDCSASELKCAAFVRAHSNSLKGQNVSAKEMMSVADLERITGITYFPNVPNAPKNTFSASDWGL